MPGTRCSRFSRVERTGNDPQGFGLTHTLDQNSIPYKNEGLGSHRVRFADRNCAGICVAKGTGPHSGPYQVCLNGRDTGTGPVFLICTTPGNGKQSGGMLKGQRSRRKRRLFTTNLPTSLNSTRQVFLIRPIRSPPTCGLKKGSDPLVIGLTIWNDKRLLGLRNKGATFGEGQTPFSNVVLGPEDPVSSIEDALSCLTNRIIRMLPP